MTKKYAQSFVSTLTNIFLSIVHVFCLTRYDVITTYTYILSAIFAEVTWVRWLASNSSLKPPDMIGHIKTLGPKCIMSSLTPACGGLAQ